MADVMAALIAEMKAATGTGDATVILAVAEKIHKAKQEYVKAEAVKAQAEATALQGVRDILAKAIKAAVKGLGLDKDIAKVKGWGFSYTIDRVEHPVGQPEVKVTGGCVLLVPATKASRASGGNGGAGKTKATYGVSLDAVFQKFATAEEKAALAAITEDPGGGKAYAIKKAVKVKAISEGKLKPLA